MQIRRATDALEQAPSVELGGDGDGVGRLAAPVEVQDGVVDALVRGPVEIAGPQPLEDVGDGVLREQHPAEHRLLGGHVLRGLTAVVLPRLRRIHVRMAEVIHDCHEASHLPYIAVEHAFDVAPRDHRHTVGQISSRAQELSCDGSR